MRGARSGARAAAAPGAAAGAGAGRGLRGTCAARRWRGGGRRWGGGTGGGISGQPEDALGWPEPGQGRGREAGMLRELLWGGREELREPQACNGGSPERCLGVPALGGTPLGGGG